MQFDLVFVANVWGHPYCPRVLKLPHVGDFIPSPDLSESVAEMRPIFETMMLFMSSRLKPVLKTFDRNTLEPCP